MNDEEQIVITGLGVLAPNGTGVERFWQNTTAGVSGISKITAFDTSDLLQEHGGQIHDFDPLDYMTEEEMAITERAAQLAIAAGKLALKDAGLSDENGDFRRRMGLFLGTTMGETQVAEYNNDQRRAHGYQAMDRSRLSRFPGNLIPATVSAILRLQGPSGLIPTACAAGNFAIGYSLELLREGHVDFMLAGGTDALSRIASYGFDAMKAITSDVVRPFDRDREGILISEGAGVLVLERAASARARGARIYAEVAGYGLGADGYHMTGPHPEGRGGIRAINQALDRAKLNPDQIDYVSAHGTGTKSNDRIETGLIKAVLGDHAYRIPVSSIKSMLGHTMGAASAIEAITCARVIQDNVVPPTINYRTADPECDLDIVPNHARDQRVDTALSNSFAFGGNCAAIILKRYRGAA